MKIAIVIVPHEIEDVKELFVSFFKQHEKYHADIQARTDTAANYEPNVGLENGVEILKIVWNRCIKKMYSDPLSKKLPKIKLSQIEIENIQLFLSPVVKGRIQYCETCQVFLEQINKNSKWQIYHNLREQKEVKLLEYKQKDILQLNAAKQNDNKNF